MAWERNGGSGVSQPHLYKCDDVFRISGMIILGVLRFFFFLLFS